jgi:hypothetical protein
MLNCTFPEEMYILVPWGETMLKISGFFLAARHGYGTEGGGDFEARHVECKAASKVFSRPDQNMALYGYSIATMSKDVFYVRVFGGAK